MTVDGQVLDRLRISALEDERWWMVTCLPLDQEEPLSFVVEV